MDYQQLLFAYNNLLDENAALKHENAELRKLMKLPMQETPKFEHTSINSATFINNYSTAEDRLTLFMSLFRGREDIFARRWYSPKTGKSGYQPVCENEWDNELCDKHKYKCNACPNRKLLPISRKYIEMHLRGNDKYSRDVVGIYPLLPDETCLFLVVDFDEDGYKKDVSAFRDACQDKGIPVYIERSRSGNGAHA